MMPFSRIPLCHGSHGFDAVHGALDPPMAVGGAVRGSTPRDLVTEEGTC